MHTHTGPGMSPHETGDAGTKKPRKRKQATPVRAAVDMSGIMRAQVALLMSVGQISTHARELSVLVEHAVDSLQGDDAEEA